MPSQFPPIGTITSAKPLTLHDIPPQIKAPKLINQLSLSPYSNQLTTSQREHFQSPSQLIQRYRLYDSSTSKSKRSREQTTLDDINVEYGGKIITTEFTKEIAQKTGKHLK